MELLAWWNLIFLLPGTVGTMLVLLSALGLGHDPDMHTDLAGDAHAEIGAGHDVDAHHEAGAGAGDHGVDSLVGDALSLLGVGRVPLMVLLPMLCLFFGFFGFGVNQTLSALLPVEGFVPISLGSALLGSFFLTGGLARIIARILPKEESYATSYRALAGQTGKVVLLLSPTEGYAQVRDRYGNFQEVRCQSLEGTPLRKGQPIIIARVQPEERLCLVVENELDGKAPPEGQQ